MSLKKTSYMPDCDLQYLRFDWSWFQICLVQAPNDDSDGEIGEETVGECNDARGE